MRVSQRIRIDSWFGCMSIKVYGIDFGQFWLNGVIKFNGPVSYSPLSSRQTSLGCLLSYIIIMGSIIECHYCDDSIIITRLKKWTSRRWFPGRISLNDFIIVLFIPHHRLFYFFKVIVVWVRQSSPLLLFTTKIRLATRSNMTLHPSVSVIVECEILCSCLWNIPIVGG